MSASLLGYELCESRGYLVNLWSSPLADTELSTPLINESDQRMYSLVGPQRSFNSSPSFSNRENRDQVTSSKSQGKSVTDPGLDRRFLDSPNQKNGSEAAFPPEAQETSSAYCVVQRLLGPCNGRSKTLNQELLHSRQLRLLSIRPSPLSQDRKAQKNQAKPSLFDAKDPGSPRLQALARDQEEFGCDEAEETGKKFKIGPMERSLPSSTNTEKARLLKRKDTVLEQAKGSENGREGNFRTQ